MQIAHASGEPASDILFDTLKEMVRLNLFYKSLVHLILTFLSR